MAHRGDVAIGVSVAIGIGAAMTYIYTRHRALNRRPNPLAACTAAPGCATILTLDAVDRADQPGGKNKLAPPGRAAAHYLAASWHSEVAFGELLAPGSPFVLYSIEQPDSDSPFLVFLSLSAEARRKMWLEEAFIDRGIRKLVELGSRVAVASLETAEQYACKAALESFVSGEWQLSFVWNTGRCGSTLMHKAVSAMGTVSLSEPHWLDQLQFNQMREERIIPALRVCVALEALIARLQSVAPGRGRPTSFVLNPKAGGMRVAEASVAAFPPARHAFMYRACHKVVESFAGLKFSRGVPMASSIVWAVRGPRALGRAAGNLDDLPLAELSSLPVAMLTLRWIQTIREWIETTSRRSLAHGVSDPLSSSVVLRMDEFTSKDLQLRSRVLRAALIHLRVIDEGAGDATIARALEVFSSHSQAGSQMSGPKAKLVTEQDVDVIKRCVVSALATKADVQEGGVNIALRGSLGIDV